MALTGPQVAPTGRDKSPALLVSGVTDEHATQEILPEVLNASQAQPGPELHDEIHRLSRIQEEVVQGGGAAEGPEGGKKPREANPEMSV